MKNIKIMLLAICLIISVMFTFGCTGTSEETEDKYAGKKCIICGSKATTSVQGTRAMCENLNDNYTSANYSEGNTSMTCTVYFCEDCDSSIPTRTGPIC